MKVSIRLQTYNQAQFLIQCLEGVNMQKTDFPFELVIGDDGSTDDTDGLIENFALRTDLNPNMTIVKLRRDEGYFQKRKQYGRLYNFYDIINHCKGEYIALLDGDDYWTDPLKLQRQVDLLDSDPSLSICFHQTLVTYDDGRQESFHNNNQKERTSLKDIVVKNYIATCSAVIRARKVNVPDIILESPIGDWIMYLHHAQYGDIHYIDSPMGVYRIHSQGLWQTKRNWDYQRQRENAERMVNLRITIGDWLNNNDLQKILLQTIAELRLNIFILDMKYYGLSRRAFSSFLLFISSKPGFKLIYKFVYRAPYALFYSFKPQDKKFG